MLVTLAYCLRDYEITGQLFDWMKELGPCSEHALLLVHDGRVPESSIQSILERAQAVPFKDVRDVLAPAQIDGWPEGANYMFRFAATYLANIRGLKDFLWLEPDAIPLKTGWLDQIEKEYRSCGKLFMGDNVEVENIPRHMSGVGVYPNPVVNHAGEALRCFDSAWDMASKDQILPNAHFTTLIEHAWRHPEFTDPNELETQIRKEAVLFHASKDGSLIKLLQGSRSRAATTGFLTDAPVHVASVSSFPSSSEGENPSPLRPFVETLEPYPNTDAFRLATSRGPIDARIPSPVYDIFIRTYPVDYPWLQFCLRSINQYATGFRKIWIVSPDKYPSEMMSKMGHEWKVMNEESEDGYLSQQIHKLYSDVVTNYESDYILHIDSDTLFTRPVTPQDFFSGDKLIWYYTPYEHTETPWKVLTGKFLGDDPPNEFMRRLPMMIPRWLYPKLREFCFEKHKVNLGDYVKRQPYREFSEFNALGAYAWKYHHDKFHWVNTMDVEMPQAFARQFYSWSGLTEEVKAEIQNILGGVTPRGGLAQSVGSSTELVPTGAVIAPAQTFNGEETPGEHVRWLERYIEGSHSRRQYVMKQLKKARLVPLRKGRQAKKT